MSERRTYPCVHCGRRVQMPRRQYEWADRIHVEYWSCDRCNETTVADRQLYTRVLKRGANQ